MPPNAFSIWGQNLSSVPFYEKRYLQLIVHLYKLLKSGTENDYNRQKPNFFDEN